MQKSWRKRIFLLRFIEIRGRCVHCCNFFFFFFLINRISRHFSALLPVLAYASPLNMISAAVLFPPKQDVLIRFPSSQSLLIANAWYQSRTHTHTHTHNCCIIQPEHKTVPKSPPESRDRIQSMCTALGMFCVVCVCTCCFVNTCVWQEEKAPCTSFRGVIFLNSSSEWDYQWSPWTDRSFIHGPLFLL